MSTTYFDRLPVELLHMIFEFLSNCDVIWSFLNLSSYLNSVLNNYSWHTLNFQSISKSRFDFICNYFDIKRIISLTLSNDLKTPGQIQLFFNRFQLQDFINLHSLTLLSITNEEIYPILSDLPKLKYLISLLTQCRSSEPLLLGQILNQLKSLENLSISHGDIFDHTVLFPLYNLKVLDIGNCNFLELRRLQMIVPSLISLKINLQANHQLQLLTDTNIWLLLERLDLTLNDQSITISFNEIEKFLSHFKNLLYLTLNIRGLSYYLADGNRWETCPIIKHLRKFNFIIHFDDSPINPNRMINKILNSFSTSFWRDIKKWYVAITTHNIYTISCFNEQLFISPPLSTSPNNRWFYSKIKRIKIEKNISLINLKHFYNLEIIDFIQENILLPINQLSHIRHLIFHQSISNTILNNILTSNLHIDHLTLSQNNFNQLFTLKTIYYLHIQDTIQISNRIQIKELCRVFPSVKQLFIHINSIKLICYIIDNLHQLENAIFNFNELTKHISQDWIKENTRLGNNTYSFTCRSESNRFLLWISNSVNNKFIRFKDKTPETINLTQKQRYHKCLLQ